MNEQTTPTITDVMTIGVPVSDQDRALEFYVNTLGLQKRRDFPAPQAGGRWIEVAPRDASVTIALVLASEGAPAGGETGIRLTALDATAVHSALQAQGVDVDELLNWPGVPPMFAFRDQDGNALRVVEAR